MTGIILLQLTGIFQSILFRFQPLALLGDHIVKRLVSGFQCSKGIPLPLKIAVDFFQLALQHPVLPADLLHGGAVFLLALQNQSCADIARRTHF